MNLTAPAGVNPHTWGWNERKESTRPVLWQQSWDSSERCLTLWAADVCYAGFSNDDGAGVSELEGSKNKSFSKTLLVQFSQPTARKLMNGLQNSWRERSSWCDAISCSHAVRDFQGQYLLQPVRTGHPHRDQDISLIPGMLTTNVLMCFDCIKNGS